MKRLLPMLLAVLLLVILSGCTFETANVLSSSSNTSNTVSTGNDVSSSEQTAIGSSSGIKNNEQTGNQSQVSNSVKTSQNGKTTTVTPHKTSSSTPLSDAKEKEMKAQMQKIIDSLKMGE